MAGYPNKYNFLMGLPITGRPIPVDVMFAFHSMAMPMNINMSMLMVRGKEVGVARNEIAEHAVANECKYIFFWDEDVACPPQSIPELIYKMEHNPDAAVIGGIYCLKRDPAEPLVFRGNGNGPYWKWRAGEFFEVTGIGMGCTLIRTELFKDLKKPWFQTVSDYSRMMDGNGGLEVWTEDLWFCDRVCKTKKWKIYADASLICAHYDMATSKPYQLPADSYPVRPLYAPTGSKKILAIGGPLNTKEGHVTTVDVDGNGNPEYRGDLRKLPFQHKEFDIVFTAALERYGTDETDEVLNEWLRCLKPGGEFRVVITDFDWAVKELAEKRIRPAQFMAGNRRTAFDLESLKALLKDHGLKDISKAKSDPAHIAVRATL